MSKLYLIGVDEAGRGPLAGPVVAAAVILGPKTKDISIKDSKKMTHTQREEAFKQITFLSIGYAISAIYPEIIDKINILEATKLAMRNACHELIKKLSIEKPCIMVDGNAKFCTKLSIETIIKGDSKIRAIGAASILAKVHRDHYMQEMAEKYPEYEFERHMGYPTKLHLDKIKHFGPCGIHRKTFKGVKEFFVEEFSS